MTIEECYQLIKSVSDLKLKNKIQQRICELEKQTRESDDCCFYSCKSMRDYQQYLYEYPMGTHRNEAITFLRKNKFRRVIILTTLILIVVALIILLLNSNWLYNNYPELFRLLHPNDWHYSLPNDY